VCRRIKRANKSSHGLFDVLNNGDDSICLIIKRNQDGRIQVDGRKVWPHAFMYHIYLTFIKGDITRTLNTGNHSELRTKDSLKVPCKFPFTNDKSEGHLCINPLHYEEKLKIEVNHYIPKSSVAEPPKALAWKSNNSPNRASTSSSTSPQPQQQQQRDKPTNMSAPPQPKGPAPQRKSEKKSDGTVHVDGSLIHQLSISDKLWGGSADAERIARNDQERIEMANNIIKYEETVARAAEKRSLHNTRSRSPRQNRKLQQEMLARGREEQEAKRDIQSIQQDLQTIDLTSDNLFDNSFDLTLQENLGCPSPPLVPTVENVVGENEDFYIASQPITLVEQPEKPWTTITYYECNNKQATYDTVKPEITFYYKSTQKPKLNTKQHQENIEQYDLAMVKNVNRSTDTWDLLEKLEQGLSLIYDRQRRLVSVANNSPIKIYILSYLMNVDCGKHEQSLIQVAPGSTRVVYDGRLFAQTIEDINNQTNSELEKWALVGQYASFFTVFRISFQPWGPQYPKKNLIECDLWLEVQMTEYLGWIQNLEDHYEYVMVQEGR